MANEQIKSNYKDIANAIRSKTGSTAPLSANEMPRAIESIETGITPSGTINITTNGDHNVTQYAEAHVEVPSLTPSGTYYIYNNDTYNISDYEFVNVNVSLDLTDDTPLMNIIDSYAGSYLITNIAHEDGDNNYWYGPADIVGVTFDGVSPNKIESVTLRLQTGTFVAEYYREDEYGPIYISISGAKPYGSTGIKCGFAWSGIHATNYTITGGIPEIKIKDAFGDMETLQEAASNYTSDGEHYFLPVYDYFGNYICELPFTLESGGGS